LLLRKRYCLSDGLTARPQPQSGTCPSPAGNSDARGSFETLEQEETVFALLTVLGPMALLQGPVSLTGTVHDSLSGKPLADAIVQLLALDDSLTGRLASTRSDSAGRFQFDGVPLGRYAADFAHPAVDTMGFERSAAVEFTLRRGMPPLRLASPSPQTVFREICRGPRSGVSTAVLIGHVLGAPDRAPLSGASVLVTRTGTSIVGDVVTRQEITEVTEVGENGGFVICEAPDDASIRVRAARGADTSGALPFRLPDAAIRHVTLTIGRARREIARVGRSADDPIGRSELVWRGPARLRGTVSNAAGAPMAGARVSVLGTGREVLTGERGTYALDSLPEGTQVVEVRAIGYEPMRPVVQLAGEEPQPLDVALLYRTITLDEVVVRGSYERNLELFEQRRRTSATGYFLRPEDIANRPREQVMAKLIEGVPQVLVRCPKALCFVTMFSGMSRPGGSDARSESSREQCQPNMYVDGLLQRVPDFNFLTAGQIAAVEVYPRRLGVPAEFMNMHNDCGSIVFWTRLHGPRR
jgi:hypothetical protein